MGFVLFPSSLHLLSCGHGWAQSIGWECADSLPGLQLSAQTLRSTQASHRRASKVVDHATVEIETLRDILRQCDELQNEFLKIKRIGEIVKGFRIRVDSLEKRIGK